MKKRITKTVFGDKFIRIMSCSGTKITQIVPKPTTIVTALALLFCASSCAIVSPSPQTQITISQPYEYGFYFNAKYVTETFTSKSGLHYIVYDDVDAGFNREILRVDAETYECIQAYFESQNGILEGSLYPNANYDLMTYTYTSDEL